MPALSRSDRARMNGFSLTPHADAERRDLKPVVPATKYHQKAILKAFKEFLTTEMGQEGIVNLKFGSPKPSQSVIKNFLCWCSCSAIGKLDETENCAPTLNSVETWWYRLKSTLQRTLGCNCTRSSSDDIVGYIRGRLSEQRELVLRMKEKNFVDGEDVRILLQQLWCEESHDKPREDVRNTSRDIVQDSALLLMHLYNAARPGAILPTQHYEVLHLCYEVCNHEIERLWINRSDVSYSANPDDKHLTKLRSLDLAVRGMPHATDDLIVYFLTLAFHDNVFQDFETPAQLLTWVNAHPEPQIRIKYKPEKLKEPVFRQAVTVIKGEETRGTYAYSVFIHHLKSLSLRAGYEKHVLPYDIRRAVANHINGSTTTAQQNQLLGHHHQNVYTKSYQMALSSVDLQTLTTGSEVDTEWNDAKQQLRRIERRARNRELPTLVARHLSTTQQSTSDHDEATRKVVVDSYFREARHALSGSEDLCSGSQLLNFASRQSSIPWSVEKLGDLGNPSIIPLLQTLFNLSLRGVQKFLESSQGYSRIECLQYLLIFLDQRGGGYYRPREEPIVENPKTTDPPRAIRLSSGVENIYTSVQDLAAPVSSEGIDLELRKHFEAKHGIKDRTAQLGKRKQDEDALEVEQETTYVVRKTDPVSLPSNDDRRL
ncbi:MAG: hypothetical protein Q9159_007564 [Coniocarpon cinnabarinum]